MRAVRKLLDNNVLFAFMLIWLVAYAGPRAYTHYFDPPVTNFVVDSVQRTGDHLVISGSMFKERCRFAGVGATGHRADGTSDPVAIEFLDNKKDVSKNRPRGYQEWGPWSLGVSGVAGIKTLSIESSHWCRLYGINQKWAEYAVQTVLVRDLVVPSFSTEGATQ